MHEPVARAPRARSGAGSGRSRETAGWMPSSWKCSWLRGLLTRAMIRSQRYFSLATWQMSMLSSSSPVTAITRSARWMPGALEHPQLGARRRTGRRARAPLDRQVAAAVGLDQRDLVALVDQLAREVPADLAAAGDDHVHRLGAPPSERALEHLDRVLGRADRLQALLARTSSARAGSITRTIDLRRRSKRCWAIWAITRFVLSPSVEAMNTSASLDARLDQRVDLDRGADGEAAAGVLPASWSGPRRGARARAGPRRGRRPRGRRRAPTAATAEPTRPAPTIEDEHRAGRRC